ncbi:hypothetical protein KGO95_00545 [Patescibacteria group bacterium]|nr:hypothetical protein [Patescibacteria group bacterium]
MKKLGLVLAMCLMPCFGSMATTAVSAVNPSTSTTVQWPDYHAKPWVIFRRVPVQVHFAQPRPPVTIGTEEEFSDGPDPNKARYLVLEASLLGNGPSIRDLLDFSSGGKRCTQVKVNGSWWTIPSNAVIGMRLLYHGTTISGVQASIRVFNGGVVKSVIFLNKNEK